MEFGEYSSPMVIDHPEDKHKTQAKPEGAEPQRKKTATAALDTRVIRSINPTTFL